MAEEIQEQEKHREDPCEPCTEEKTPTQKCINIERREYCNQYYAAAGEVKKWEKSYNKQADIYERKKCQFVRTEKNYRIHRNLRICVGTELLQSSEVLKRNVTEYVKWNNELSTTLKELFAEAKSVKTKMCDLRDQACKLENCINDSCNSSQWQVIIGETEKSEKYQGKRPKECADIKDRFDELICWPKSLSFDVDSIFKSSSEVIGIQIFSNLGSLESLQQTLTTCATQFDTHVQKVVTARETDLKTIHEELITSVKDTTVSNLKRFGVRSDFDGLANTLDFMCCPDCDCIQDCTCEPRLKECEEKICNICKSVKNCFCREPKEHQRPEAAS